MSLLDISLMHVKLSIVLLSVSPANDCMFVNFPVSCGRISGLHFLHYCIEQSPSRDARGFGDLGAFVLCCIPVSTFLSCHMHLITSAV